MHFIGALPQRYVIPESPRTLRPQKVRVGLRLNEMVRWNPGRRSTRVERIRSPRVPLSINVGRAMVTNQDPKLIGDRLSKRAGPDFVRGLGRRTCVLVGRMESNRAPGNRQRQYGGQAPPHPFAALRRRIVSRRFFQFRWPAAGDW